MFLAREAKCSVLAVSSTDRDDGDTHASIKVRPSPPSESINSRVSLESRYGICPCRLRLSAKAEITLPG
eukprot:scaffold28437_cov118-Isochrysis_galbana.AAC.1